MAEQHEIKEYSDDLQKLFLEFLIGNGELASRCQGILEADYFSRRLNPAADFIKKYVDQHSMVPTAEQVNATCGTNLQQIDPTANVHADWFLGEFEQFCRYKALEKAILKSADMLEKQQYGGVEKLIREATQIGLAKSFGTDYYADPRARLGILKDANGQVSTGWKTVDEKLYGGFNRGELNIFAGGSGSGKSLFMMNIAINWLQAGLSGVYISLELSEGLTSLRTDAMIANMGTKEIRRNIDDAVMKLNVAKKKFGEYRIKAMPAQNNVNDIRAYIKEMEIQSGTKVDFIMVDYLDLLMPASAKVSPNDLFVKDKYVSEELRNLAEELNVFFITASQLNRSAVEEIEFDHSHISGGISKINTADNVFGIFTSRAMKERGKYQIQCMKNRSGAGAGQKVDLDYNIETMRITDPGLENQDRGPAKPMSSVLDQIKTSTVVNSMANKSVPVAEVNSAKLKSMLAGLKTNA